MTDLVGGRVLDTGALVQFAVGKPEYMRVLVWVALQETITLTVPTCVLAEAEAIVQQNADQAQLDALHALLRWPVVHVYELTTTAALGAGRLLAYSARLREPWAAVSAAHVVECATRRPGWPVVTDRPDLLRELHGDLELDVLP